MGIRAGLVGGYSCGQKGSPVAACVAADLKQPLIGHTVVESLCCEDVQGFPLNMQL